MGAQTIAGCLIIERLAVRILALDGFTVPFLVIG